MLPLPLLLASGDVMPVGRREWEARVACRPRRTTTGCVSSCTGTGVSGDDEDDAAETAAAPAASPGGEAADCSPSAASCSSSSSSLSSASAASRGALPSPPSAPAAGIAAAAPSSAAAAPCHRSHLACAAARSLPQSTPVRLGLPLVRACTAAGLQEAAAAGGAAAGGRRGGLRGCCRAGDQCATSRCAPRDSACSCCNPFPYTSSSSSSRSTLAATLASRGGGWSRSRSDICRTAAGNADEAAAGRGAAAFGRRGDAAAAAARRGPVTGVEGAAGSATCGCDGGRSSCTATVASFASDVASSSNAAAGRQGEVGGVGLHRRASRRVLAQLRGALHVPTRMRGELVEDSAVAEPCRGNGGDEDCQQRREEREGLHTWTGEVTARCCRVCGGDDDAFTGVRRPRTLIGAEVAAASSMSRHERLLAMRWRRAFG